MDRVERNHFAAKTRIHTAASPGTLAAFGAREEGETAIHIR
jgi:hypothetical protein